MKSKQIEVIQEPLTSLPDYARVSIVLDIGSIFDVSRAQGRASDFVLTERAVNTHRVKDYDAIAGEGPTGWRARFDLSTWGIFAARSDGRRVGGAAVAFRSPGVEMLEGRDDLAVLWDIRVASDMRGNGVGTALLFATRIRATRRES